jgi:hypothetical protein
MGEEADYSGARGAKCHRASGVHYLLNTLHPDFKRIKIGKPSTVKRPAPDQTRMARDALLGFVLWGLGMDAWHFHGSASFSELDG